MLRRSFLIVSMVILGLVSMLDQSLAERLGSDHLVRVAQDIELSPYSVVAHSTKQRASSAHIGSIMAILATFDEANALPPEHDPQANQLIHTLIQLQSTVMKSQDAAVPDWVLRALQAKLGRDLGEKVQGSLPSTGLTMDVLVALVDDAESHSPWGHAALAQSLYVFNVQQDDWALLRTILVNARTNLEGKGETLSRVFSRRRLEMPGARQ